MPDPVQTVRRVYYDAWQQEYALINDVSETYQDDQDIQVLYNHVTDLDYDGTYIMRYEFSGPAGDSDSDSPVAWQEWKYVRADDGDTRTTSTRSGFGTETDPDFEEVAFEGGNDPTQVYLSASMAVGDYCDLVVLNADEDTLCAKVPGGWSVQRQITFNSTETEALNEIATFELRLLTIKNYHVEKVQVDPNSEDHTAKFRADLYALPVGWVPDDSQTWNYTGWSLWIYDETGGTVLETFGPITPTALGSGKIAEIEFDWDGRYNRQGTPGPNSDPVEGMYSARFGAGTLTDQVPAPIYLTGTGARPKETPVKICGCRCKQCEKAAAGNTFMVFDLMAGMLQSFVGPPLQCAISYCSLNKDKPAASMGSGWSGTSTARVLEPEGQDGSLVYRSEGGVNLRWDLVGEAYVPTTSDNKIQIAKTGDPDATYVLTFQDQSQREFNEDGLLMRTVDRNGLALTYAYTAGILTSMTDASSQVLSFDYGTREDGQPVSLSTLSRQTTLDYDVEDRLSVITDPAGQTTAVVYNEDGLLWKIQDTRANDAMTYLYDAEGRVISQQIYDQTLVSTYYEGSAGFEEAQLTYLFYPDRAVIDGFYSTRGVLTVTEDLTEASPPQLSMSFFDVNGKVVCREDMAVPGDLENTVQAVSNRTEMEFNDPNDSTLMTRMINPNLAETLWTYDEDGNVKTVVDNDGNTTEYFYAQELDSPLNPLHKNLLRLVIRPGSTLSNPSLEMIYDEDGHVQRVYDEKRNYTDFDINSLGLVEAVTDRRGNTTTMGYDGTTHRLLTITGPEDVHDAHSGRTLTLGHDDYGNVNSVSDDLSNTILYEFDGVDRVTKITDALSNEVVLNYVDGLLDNVVAPPNFGSYSATRSTRFTYDGAGRLTLTESEVATSTYQSRVGYAYTGFSQLKQLKRWKDATLKYTQHFYDPLGRMISSKDFGERETTVDFAPFCVENTVTSPRGVARTSSFNNLCQLTRLEDNEQTRRFRYDNRGRVTKVSMDKRVEYGTALYDEPGNNYAITRRFEYDALDLVTKVLLPDGKTISYLYDEEENLIQVTDTFGRTTDYSYLNDGRLYQVTHAGGVFTYEYDEVGRLARIVYPSGTDLVASFTKTDTSSGWDANGRLVSLRYLKGGNHLHRFEYSYDESGNRNQLIDTPENTSNQVTWDYLYDWLNRLVYVWRDSLAISAYDYDESDNRVQWLRPEEDIVWTYGFDIADRIESRSLAGSEFETFEHDDDGNMISRTLTGGATTTYSWDSDNRLRLVEEDSTFKASAEYDFAGIRRVSYQAGEVATSKNYSSGGMPLSENSRDGGTLSFIQGHQLLGLNDGSELFYYISDGLGSVRLILDSDGDVVASFSSNEFGVEESSSGTRTDLNYGTYVGALGVRNDPSGLLYMRQRYYDPQLGRFLNQDPIGFAGGLNLFTYVDNNPTTMVDPSGLQNDTPTGGTYVGGGIYQNGPSSYHNYGLGGPGIAGAAAASTYVWPGGNAGAVASGTWVGPGGNAAGIAARISRGAMKGAAGIDGGIAQAIARGAAGGAAAGIAGCPKPAPVPGPVAEFTKNHNSAAGIIGAILSAAAAGTGVVLGALALGVTLPVDVAFILIGIGVSGIVSLFTYTKMVWDDYHRALNPTSTGTPTIPKIPPGNAF